MYKVTYDLRGSNAIPGSPSTVEWWCKNYDFKGNFLVMETARRFDEDDIHHVVAIIPERPVIIDLD